MYQTDLAKWDKKKAEISIFVEPIKQLIVVDKGSLDIAMEVGRNIKLLLKSIEDDRVAYVKPINDHVKTINDYAKDLKAPLEQAESHIKGHLRAYEIELDKKRRAEMDLIAKQQKEAAEAAIAKLRLQKAEQERLARFQDEPEQKMAHETLKANAERMEKEILADSQTKTNAVMENKVAGSKKVWKFEVTDANQVPRQFLVVEEKIIRAAVNIGTREIPGVRIYEDVQISLGSR